MGWWQVGSSGQAWMVSPVGRPGAGRPGGSTDRVEIDSVEVGCSGRQAWMAYPARWSGSHTDRI